METGSGKEVNLLHFISSCNIVCVINIFLIILFKLNSFFMCSDIHTLYHCAHDTLRDSSNVSPISVIDLKPVTLITSKVQISHLTY